MYGDAEGGEAGVEERIVTVLSGGVEERVFTAPRASELEQRGGRVRPGPAVLAHLLQLGPLAARRGGAMSSRR